MMGQALMSGVAQKTAASSTTRPQVRLNFGRRDHQCASQRERHLVTVGTPGDSYEQEAERVADEVMTAPRLGVRPAARLGLSNMAPGDIGPGQSLDSDTREFFEHRFGSDFSQVRVHADSGAAQSAMSVKRARLHSRLSRCLWVRAVCTAHRTRPSIAGA